MRIEDLAVELRPRSGFEAIELGFALSRRHAGLVLMAWLLLSLPVLGLLVALCWPLDLLWLPGLILWWLKPAFARVPLYVYSRAVFGHTPSLGEVLRAQRAFGLRSLLPWLLWRRPLPGRSLLMPVDLLEGLKGPALRQRRRVVARDASPHAALLLLVCLHIEALLFFSGLALVVMLVPIEFMGEAAQAVWETMLVEPPPWAEVVALLLYWLCVSIVEPFHVGGGFGLYLNRRTRLEAWDIELGFRRLARRLAGAPALGMLLALGLMSAMPSRHAQAAEPAEDRAGPREVALPAQADGFKRVFAQAHVDGVAEFVDHSARVYESEELNPVEVRGGWVPRNPAKPQKGKSKPSALEKLMHSLGRGLAFVIENILWLIAAALLVVAALSYRHWWPRLEARLPGMPRRRPRMEALPEDGELPPADFPKAAAALWRRGESRAALAVLYRGALLRLGQRLDQSLPPGSTEADGLRRARRLADPAFETLFARTVACWQATAYARRLPPEPEFEALLRGWQEQAPAGPVEAAA